MVYKHGIVKDFPRQHLLFVCVTSLISGSSSLPVPIAIDPRCRQAFSHSGQLCQRFRNVLIGVYLFRQSNCYTDFEAKGESYKILASLERLTSCSKWMLTIGKSKHTRDVGSVSKKVDLCLVIDPSDVFKLRFKVVLFIKMDFLRISEIL